MTVISFLVSVLANLISNQIDAWLPAIARYIIKYQASKMPAQPLRWEEEWLRDLDRAKGGLAKLVVALRTIGIPLKSVREVWLQRAQSLDYRLFAIWFVIALAIASLIVVYPPHSSRIASYVVVIVPLVLVGLLWPSPVRDLLVDVYEAQRYVWRVAACGLWVPLITGVIVAQSLVPPGRHAPAPGPSDSPAPATRVFIVTVQAPDESEGRRASRHQTRQDLGPRDDTAEAPPKLLQLASVPLVAFEPDTLPTPESTLAEGPTTPAPDAGEHERTSTELSDRATVSVGEALPASPATSLTVIEVRVVPLPEQPVPSTQPLVPVPVPPARGAPPAAPRNLRIIR
jgi:hypothetical protein